MFHLPTIYGIESNSKLALGEVGKDGVAIDTLQDMEDLFNGIDLSKISTSMTINAPALILLCMYCAVGEKQGLLDMLTGTIQNDILKEYIAQKSWISSEQFMRLIIDTIEFFTRVTKVEYNQYFGVSYSRSRVHRGSGIGVYFSEWFAYVEAALARGLNVDDFAPRLSFFFNAHNNFFEEIAKLAARRIWPVGSKKNTAPKKNVPYYCAFILKRRE